MILRQKKTQPPPDTSIYWWCSEGTLQKDSGQIMDCFSLSAGESCLHGESASCCAAIFRDICIALFTAIPTVTVARYEEFIPPKKRRSLPPQGEIFLDCLARWKNDPTHVFLKKTFAPPEGRGESACRITTLSVQSEGADCQLVREIFYQLERGLCGLYELNLELFSQKIASDPPPRGTAPAQMIKKRPDLYIYLDKTHPTLFFQVLQGLESPMPRCKEIVERHGKSFKSCSEPKEF